MAMRANIGGEIGGRIHGRRVRDQEQDSAASADLHIVKQGGPGEGVLKGYNTGSTGDSKVIRKRQAVPLFHRRRGRAQVGS